MQRLELLDYARFIAAIFVICFHYFFGGINSGIITSIKHVPMLVNFSKYGYLGVEFFFMISGFVIFFSAINRSASEFAISRCLRLYPAFIFAVIFTTFFSIFLANQHMQVTPMQFIANLSMMAPGFGQNYVDGVYWTLGYEIKFYMLVLIIMLFRQQSRLDKLFLIWPYIMVTATLLDHGYLTYLGGYYFYFAGGALFAIYSRKPSRFTAITLIIVYIFCIRFSVLPVDELSNNKHVELSLFTHLSIVTSFFVFFYFLNTPYGSNLNLYKSKLLGALTYPVYLIHAYFGYMLINHLANDDNKYFIYPFVITIVLFIAYFMHIFIEKKMYFFWKRIIQASIGSVVLQLESITEKLATARQAR